MERTAVEYTLTSPYGEMEWFDNYGLFTPFDDVTPALLHVNYKDMEPDVMNGLQTILNNPAPPIILFTYGDRPVNVAGLFQQWRERKFYTNIVAAFSIVCTKVGFDGGYATVHDNIHQDLEDLMNVAWGEGKQVGVGSSIIEAFAASFNIPAVSLYLYTATRVWDLFTHILQRLPVEGYPDYDYTAKISTPFIQAIETVCGCCGKRRGPLKFFYTIQSNICPVCERKIKHYGKMGLMNLIRVQQDIQQARTITRRANSEKLMRQASYYRCLVPGCESILKHKAEDLHACLECKRDYFVRGKQMFEVREVQGMRYVYSYTLRNSGYAVLQKVTLLVNDRSPVFNCEWCNRTTTRGKYVTDLDGVAYRICHRCAPEVDRALEELTTEV